jgi:peptidase E
VKIMLTSCGFETKAIQKQFLNYIDKSIADVKALFIPTAAIDADAIGVLPKCMNDLLKCKIKKENITVYDLHKPINNNDLALYDVIYLCGGNAQYLLSRVNEIGFNHQLFDFINRNGIVVGVSAGSLILANNMPDSLSIIKQRLNVHCSNFSCEKAGIVDENKDCIMLGNEQALIIENNNLIIIE